MRYREKKRVSCGYIMQLLRCLNREWIWQGTKEGKWTMQKYESVTNGITKGGKHPKKACKILAREEITSFFFADSNQKYM